MKKNISKLVAEITCNTTSARKDRFKVTSQNASRYVNKILVDSEEYNKPGILERYIHEEMKVYEIENSNKNVTDLKDNVKRKTEKPKGIEHQLNLLERNFNLLVLEELFASLRAANKEEKLSVRDKLTKLESSMSFTLENEELDPHLEEMLNEFLNELTQIINKSSKVY